MLSINIHSLRPISDSAGTLGGVIIEREAIIQSTLASRDAFGVGSHLLIFGFDSDGRDRVLQFEFSGLRACVWPLAGSLNLTSNT